MLKLSDEIFISFYCWHLIALVTNKTKIRSNLRDFEKVFVLYNSTHILSGWYKLLKISRRNSLFQINSDLYIVTDGTKRSRTQLLPCHQSHELTLNDTLPHVVQLECRGALLRIKVDEITVYPKKVLPNSCDKWLFFSPVPHINSEFCIHNMAYLFNGKTQLMLGEHKFIYLGKEP